MANPNLLNQNPILIYGTMGSYKAAVQASQGSYITLRIIKVIWLNPKLAGDVALITDPADGSQLLKLVATLPYAGVAAITQTQDFRPPKLWADFQVTQLDSGELEIWTI